MRVRRPAVAGLFYPSDKEDLIGSIRSAFLSHLGPGKLPPAGSAPDVLGYVVPHAGYEYSGPVAAHAYYEISGLEEGSTFVILGPNHYGIGSGVAVPQSDEWETPLGTVKIDVELLHRLVRSSSIVDIDDGAHWREHSIEVQVPFLQFVKKDFKILPISMMLMEKGVAVEVAEALYRLYREKKFYVLASSDMTHYEPKDSVLKKDTMAIDAITKGNIDELYRLIYTYDITMCGYGPVAVLMHMSALLSYKGIRLLKHADSGDSTGDNSSVVGYASIGFYRQ